MNSWTMTCAALVVALAGTCVFGDGPKPTPTLSDAGAKAIKDAYPNATIGAAKLNMDRGLQVYFVELSGDKSVTTAEVTATGTVVQGDLKLDQKDLPAAVSKAATDAAGDGATYVAADQLDLKTEFSPKEYNSGAKISLVPSSKPTTVYDITFSKNGIKGVVRVDTDGKVVGDVNWMKRASADVPAGKLVIRANLGCDIDYTDASGIVWAADQKYTKESKWGFLDGRPHFRTGLKVPNTDAPFIYDSERDKEGAYRFDVPNGTYTVRIHFCETWEGARKPNLREFGIKIQGTKLVDKMDISGAAGGWMIPMVKEFKDIEVKDGKLVVEPFSNNNRDQHPSVEAYEVYAQ